MEEESDKPTAKELMRAIKGKCLDCCNGQLAEARARAMADCPLTPTSPKAPLPPIRAKARSSIFRAMP